MIKIEIQRTLPFPLAGIFSRLDDIVKLRALKKDIRELSLVRSESGLQIADATIGLPLFLSFRARLSCATRLEKYCELKQVKGEFREYLCIYELSDSQGGTDISVSVTIRFRFGFAMIISFLIEPLLRRRIEREFARIEKLELARAL
ncbi:MAG: hypothetical protein EPN93_05285 [Spirochaetes bacterium]|nr:MAG: hypothetical protein EPN93_05285 [Spirochaetota bacterium]